MKVLLIIYTTLMMFVCERERVVSVKERKYATYPTHENDVHCRGRGRKQPCAPYSLSPVLSKGSSTIILCPSRNHVWRNLNTAHIHETVMFAPGSQAGRVGLGSYHGTWYSAPKRKRDRTRPRDS